MKAKRKTRNGRRSSRQNRNSRLAKASLRHSRGSTDTKHGKLRKSRPGRPPLGSLVQSLPDPGYQSSRFVLPYIGQMGKVVGYQKNYNSVKVKFADGFILGHAPKSLRRAG